MLGKRLKFVTLYSLISLVCFIVFLFYSRGSSPDVATTIQTMINNNNNRFWGKIKEHGQMTETPVRQSLTAIPAHANKTLESCPDTPPHLVGPLHVEFETKRTLENVKQQIGPLLQQGGRYKPPDCISKHKVAIIIPFRNRHHHLIHWLYYLHPMLIRQQLDYGVYVINQDGDGVFNKARLMNAGYVEALKEYDYDCFVFSDVDMVPLDDRNLYRCFDKPRHLAVAIDKFNFVLPYDNVFGGVVSLSKKQFSIVNGFSNTFWGWGGEDDDLYNRVMFKIKSISRPDSKIARYKMIKHNRDQHNEVNQENPYKIRETKKTFDQDGLNSLSYTVKEIKKESLYTFINVDVQAPTG